MGLLPSGFLTRIPCEPLLFPICATCPAHLILHDLINRIIFDERYRPLSFSSCSLLKFPVTSSLLGPNIFLRTLFSYSLSLHFCMNTRDDVSHPYKTTGKIMHVPYKEKECRFTVQTELYPCLDQLHVSAIHIAVFRLNTEP